MDEGAVVDDVIVLSDEEQLVRGGISDVSASTSPVCQRQSPSKKPRLSSSPPVLVLDDDVTPQRLSSMVVPETPLSSSVVIVKCSSFSNKCSDAGINRLICLESDNENESDCAKEDGTSKENTTSSRSSGRANETSHVLTSLESALSAGASTYYDSTEIIQDELPSTSFHDTYQPEELHSSFGIVHSDNLPFNLATEHVDKENFNVELMDDDLYPDSETDVNVQNNDSDQKVEEIAIRESRPEVNRKKNGTNRVTKNKLTKEEKQQMMEENKQKKEHEKLQKAITKAEAAEMKKIQKEKQRWEKGKFALKSIVAQIDAKVVESGSIGGHLLSRLTEKGLTFRIKSNPVERSIVWSMNVPEHISEICSGRDISYISLVYEAEEFFNLVSSGSLLKQVQSVRSLYPSHTICYIISRLLAYINKREQESYRGPINDDRRTRPPVEEVLAKLSVHFDGVHSRLCIDELEVAEHVVGLTCSLATCLYRKKLTKLSVNANGSNIPKGAVDKTLLKNNCWLKALMAIPKVQPRFAIAIWKKYPSMKSLLKVYLDPGKSIHEKEFLLKDLTTEGLVADDRRLGEVCSKRVYRVLMAQSGNIKTDDVENGADFFGNASLCRSSV